MPLTLSGSTGQTGSLVLTDTDINSTVSVSLDGSMSVVTAPANIPANTSDTNWNVNAMYATSMYKNTLTANTTGTALSFSSVPNGLCQTGNCTKVNSLYVKNLGGENLTVSWSSKLNTGTANSTTDGFIVPPYGVAMFSIPMGGLTTAGTSGINFKTSANSTTAYVVLAYQ
jgi:hypothetical protein